MDALADRGMEAQSAGRRCSWWWHECEWSGIGMAGRDLEGGGGFIMRTGDWDGGVAFQ